MILENGSENFLDKSRKPKKENKSEKTEQPKEYKLRKTYEVDLSELGFKQKYNFNAYNFFIEKKPIEVRGQAIYFNEEDKYVYGPGDSKLTIIEFLAQLGIGLQEGAFTIQDYALATKEQRKDMEDSEDLPN